MSIEKDVKQQFARIFEKSDWMLFEAVAESYLQQAARLRKRHLRGVSRSLSLLARNS
jgi:2-oxo-4-hydroxy-4-carboxy--5-ureidoimidazoline (OHCU) decarboxylase